MDFKISQKYYAWLTVVLFAFFIFFLSAVPDLRSGLDTTLDIILRKIAHATEFGVLAYFIFLACENCKFPLKKSLVLAAFLALLYALSDEYHQSFVPGREMAVLDFFVDSTGVVLVLFLLWTKKRIINKLARPD